MRQGKCPITISNNKYNSLFNSTFGQTKPAQFYTELQIRWASVNDNYAGEKQPL